MPAVPELLAILTLPDLSERPRTIPENHEVDDEDEDEDNEDSVEEEVAEDRDRFISLTSALKRNPHLEKFRVAMS